MNSIQRKLSDGIFTKIFKHIYESTSSNPFIKDLNNIPIELKDYLDLLYTSFNIGYDVKNTIIIDKIKIQNSNKILVASSGGKDSTATVIKLKYLGYDPIMFYVKGINKSYPHEEKAVKKISEILSCDLNIESINIQGKKEWVENPTKNHLILAMMIDYGVNIGIHNYSFGAIIEDDMSDESRFQFMFSDLYEMYKILEEFYVNFIENFTLKTILKDDVEAYDIITTQNNWKEILENRMSCMMPLRYKKNIRQKWEKKYNINISENSCGASCIKCCQEHYVLNQWNFNNYPKKFIDDCIKGMEKSIRSVNKSILKLR